MIWTAVKVAFKAVKKKHGSLLFMVSRKRLKSNYEKIRNNRLDHMKERFFYEPEVESMLVAHGVEDGAILIDRKGRLIDNHCALPLDFKKWGSRDRPSGGVRRATAINVTKRFKGLAMMIRSNGLVAIVYRGKVTGILSFTETPFGGIVPLVEKVDLDYFPEISSFPPQLKNRVRLFNIDRLLARLNTPFTAKLDYYNPGCGMNVSPKVYCPSRFPVNRQNFRPQIRGPVPLYLPPGMMQAQKTAVTDPPVQRTAPPRDSWHVNNADRVPQETTVTRRILDHLMQYHVPDNLLPARERNYREAPAVGGGTNNSHVRPPSLGNENMTGLVNGIYTRVVHSRQRPE